MIEQIRALNDDGKRFIVHAEEKLTASLELEGRFFSICRVTKSKANCLPALAQVAQQVLTSFVVAEHNPTRAKYAGPLS